MELNPPVKGRDRTDGMFSRASLESMRIEGKQYYDALFAAEAAKTGKRSPSGSASTISVDVTAKCNSGSDQGPLAGSSAASLLGTTPLYVTKPPISQAGADSCGLRAVAATPSDDWLAAGGKLKNSAVTLSTHRIFAHVAAELQQGCGGVHPPALPHGVAGQVVVRQPLGRGCAAAAGRRLGPGEEEQSRHLRQEVLGGAQRCETGAAGPAVAARSHACSLMGPLSSLAATGHWDALCEQMFSRLESTLVSGGPGVGKTTFLRKYCAYLRKKFDADGQVVVCAPTGSAAKTAVGVTYHSFVGFELKYVPQLVDPVDEAARLLATKRFSPIRRRLGRVRVLFLDEISMVPADRFDVMIELLAQSRGDADCAAVVYPFGDFLQLRPTHGQYEYEATCWPRVFGGKFVDLTRVMRQRDAAFVSAIRDARFGVCTADVLRLVAERTVSDEKYEELELNVLHLIPTHGGVLAHNQACLRRLAPEGRPAPFVSHDFTRLDKNCDAAPTFNHAKEVSAWSCRAALTDCVAPRMVEHCRQARVMYTSNAKAKLGLCHGSIGWITDYKTDGTPIVRFPHTPLPHDIDVKSMGVRDAGDTWIEVECPAVEFEARVHSSPGMVAVRKQVPFVLGWAITVHRSQSLTLSEAVLDLAHSFEAGMVHAALSRVSDKANLYIKSFLPGRLFAHEGTVAKYLQVWQRA